MINYELTFDDAGHKYKLNGRPLPTVSEIVSLISGNTYAGIPAEILNNAAAFGTDVHKMIQVYNETGIIKYTDDFKKYHCLNEWVKLSERFEKIVQNEIMVHYFDLYAGTFDSLAIIDGDLILIDYKTTNKFHRLNVTIQLNLYRIAYEWKTGKKVRKLAAIWLPKHRPGKIEYVDLIDDFELLETVKNVLSQRG